jgi:hypothetical protein
MDETAIAAVIAADFAICALVIGTAISGYTAFIEAEASRAALTVIFAFNTGILFADLAMRAIFVVEAACAN